MLSCIDTISSKTDQKSTQISFQFSQLRLKNEDELLTINLQGCNSELIQSDHYILPVRVETLFFPSGTKIKEISYHISEIHSERLMQKLPVTSKPAIKEDQSQIYMANDKAGPLTKDRWLEYETFSGLIDGSRMVIVKISIYPVQYHPDQDLIKWTDKISLEICYEPADTNSIYSVEYDLLILCADRFLSDLETFTDHKNNRGTNTICVTLEEIYDATYFPLNGRDEPEQIKYFLHNAVEEWGINAVLLIGGEKEFPVRTVKPQNSFSSDLYYADLYNAEGGFCSWDDDMDMIFGEYSQDNVDLMPDVNIGRLACVSSQQVKDCVNKITHYENDMSFTKDWFSDFVVIAGDCFPNQGISEGESATQVALETMDEFNAIPLWASNGGLDGTDPSGVDQIDLALNNGPGFLYYSGHSSPTHFYTFPRNESRRLPTPIGYYSNDHVAALINNDRLPIVVFDSCSPCNFRMSDDCLGWSFVSNPLGGGIGFFGATTYSLCHLGDQFTEGLAIKLALNFFDAYRNSNDTYLGQIWSRAILDYIFPGMTSSDHVTLMQWEPFIDPTLMIRINSNPPDQPERPNGPSSGTINSEYCYSSSSIDIDDDIIFYLFDWGDDTDSGWIGPIESGQEVQVNKTWKEKGEYTIRVKAKDIHDLQSEWSDPLTVNMPRSRSPYPFRDAQERLSRVISRLQFFITN